MVIACDTSFLFSPCGNNVHSAAAVAWAARSTRGVHLTTLTHYEFGNALRFAGFHKAIPVGSASVYWAGFESAIAQGGLVVATTNLADVVDEAKRISAIRPPTGGHQGFDILHVAGALKMKATRFLAFDVNQKLLAEAEGLLVPV